MLPFIEIIERVPPGEFQNHARDDNTFFEIASSFLFSNMSNEKLLTLLICVHPNAGYFKILFTGGAAKHC